MNNVLELAAAIARWSRQGQMSGFFLQGTLWYGMMCRTFFAAGTHSPIHRLKGTAPDVTRAELMNVEYSIQELQLEMSKEVRTSGSVAALRLMNFMVIDGRSVIDAELGWLVGSPPDEPGGVKVGRNLNRCNKRLAE
jgi:hypothetical protein